MPASGMVSASTLLVFVVSTIVGTIVGLLLGSTPSVLTSAMIAGLVGVLAAWIVVNAVLGMRRREHRIPPVILLFSLVSAVAGSLAAVQLTVSLGTTAPALLGGLAGALSAILMLLLVVAHRMDPPPRPVR